jgi:hypothetical protein
VRPALPVMVAFGKQRSPKASKRVDAIDARGVAFARSAYWASPSCASGDGVVIHRHQPLRHEMVVEDLAELCRSVKSGEGPSVAYRCSRPVVSSGTSNISSCANPTDRFRSGTGSS